MTTKVAGTDGNVYVPYEKRSGNVSKVFFTRDLSAAGLQKIFDRVSEGLTGKIAVKVHTGEAQGPNIIPCSWIKELYDSRLEGATIVETNTYYKGSRYTTEDHLKTLEINGWTFCPVDIMDANGTKTLPVKNGKWLEEVHTGETLPSYDSFLALTHFKGHTMGGFGGSNKNIGIGCADGRIGKGEIHSRKGSNNPWEVVQEEFMERMTESTKATIDYFKDHISYINVMRNMSVSCDCEGPAAEPVITPDIGILASYDILAVDNACIDLIYNLPEGAGKALIERVETRHGLRQLSYMKELGMGNDLYELIDIDHDDQIISAQQAVKDIKPVWIPDVYNTFKGKNNF
ncbi:MAG: DUF362 domain-containing protein [Bacillota bacterium]|nr:DUF362 domain-containing protein [Bacillota bacterium]